MTVGRGAHGSEDPGGIGVHGLVQPEPVYSGRSLDNGLIDQRRQQANDVVTLDLVPGADGLGCGKGKA